MSVTIRHYDHATDYHDVNDFLISHDSARVAFRVDPAQSGRDELFLVEVATPGVATRVNTPTPSSSYDVWNNYRFTADDARIVYYGDVLRASYYEVFVTEVANLGVSIPITGDHPHTSVNLPSGIVVGPTGKVFFRTDWNGDGVYEILGADATNPAAGVKVQSPWLGPIDVGA